jgi:transcriptional regulator with XRE-family HTH domain
MARPRGYPLNKDAFEWLLNQHLGKSLTHVAEAAGIQRATLSGLVGGYQRASAPMAHKLANAMDCKVGLLFPTLGSSADRFTETEAVA